MTEGLNFRTFMFSSNNLLEFLSTHLRFLCSVFNDGFHQFTVTCDQVSVFNAEGPPVPIPNTEVKLCSAEDTCLATDRENRSMLTQSTLRNLSVLFLFIMLLEIQAIQKSHLYCILISVRWLEGKWYRDSRCFAPIYIQPVQIHRSAFRILLMTDYFLCGMLLFYRQLQYDN